MTLGRSHQQLAQLVLNARHSFVAAARASPGADRYSNVFPCLSTKLLRLQFILRFLHSLYHSFISLFLLRRRLLCLL